MSSILFLSCSTNTSRVELQELLANKRVVKTDKLQCYAHPVKVFYAL